MVSQVLESGRLCVNKSKLEVLDGLRTGRTSHQCRDCPWSYQSTFRSETIRAATVKYLGCQVESQGSTRAEAQMRVSKAIEAQARYSRGLWAPRSIGLTTKIRLWQALVRSVLLYAGEAHAWQPRDVETLENGKIEHYDTLQEPLFMCLESARKTYSEEERTGACEAMRAMVFGRLSIEKEQAPPSRFVRQFLEDLDALRRCVCKRETAQSRIPELQQAFWELSFFKGTVTQCQ